MEYRAWFKDDKGMPHWRKFFAKHITMAHRKASAIAKSHNWTITSVGQL